MSVDVELAKHVGHRAVLVDTRHLRCVDCTRTVLLPNPLTAVPQRSYDPPRPADPRCPEHPWEHAGVCRACRAEQLADEHRTRPPVPSTEQGRAAARALATAALAAREETDRAR